MSECSLSNPLCLCALIAYVSFLETGNLRTDLCRPLQHEHSRVREAESRWSMADQNPSQWGPFWNKAGGTSYIHAWMEKEFLLSKHPHYQQVRLTAGLQER